MSMILFVLHDSEKLREVLDAWEEAGISGATVLFNTGIGRIHENQALRDDLPMLPTLEDFLPDPRASGSDTFHHYRRREPGPKNRPGYRTGGR